MKKLAIILVFCLILFGCKKETRAEQVVLPDGQIVQVDAKEIIPASTEYKGEGVKYSRKVEISRSWSPFGKGAGEVLDGQKPAQIATGEAPAINITPQGVNVATGAETKFTGGSGSATWLSSIWTKLKDWLWIGGIGLAVIYIVPIIFPSLAPIFGAITGFFGRLIAWAIPWFGAIGQWIENRFHKTAFTQTVKGNEDWKTKLFARTDITQEIKDSIWNDFVTSQMANQDSKVQTAVDKITK